MLTILKYVAFHMGSVILSTGPFPIESIKRNSVYNTYVILTLLLASILLSGRHDWMMFNRSRMYKSAV